MSEQGQRVSRSSDALYSEPRTANKRRRCSGHLAAPHWIEKGDQYVSSSLPPNDPEINNDSWWHAQFCMACAPMPVGVQ